MADTDESKSGIYHRELDTDHRDPALQVVRTISALEDTESHTLSPIYDTIDDLLGALFSTPPATEARAKLEFRYEGYRITIHHDGHATFVDSRVQTEE